MRFRAQAVAVSRLAGLHVHAERPEQRSRLIAIRPQRGQPVAVLCRVSLAAWFALGLVAQVLGLMHTRGWPLRPRPWPTWAAYAHAFGVTLLVDLPQLLGNAAELPVVPFLIAACFSSLQTAALFRSACQRRLSCDLTVCLRVYCRRHGLPGLGWGLALAIAVFFCVKMSLLSFNSFCKCKGVPMQDLELELLLKLSRQFFQVVQMNLGSCLLLLHVTVVGVLTTGLRRDCAEVALQSYRGGADAWQWRSLRLRQQILFDAFLGVNATAPERLLTLVLFTLVFPSATFAYTFNDGMPSLDVEVVVNLAIATSIVLLFLCNGIASQWFSIESVSIKQVIHRHLARKTSRHDEETNELHAFVQQIDRQSKKGSVMGLFELNGATVSGVIFSIATYCAFALQEQNDLL